MGLARAELSPAQESAHIARRKVVWEEINSEAGGKSLPTSLSDGRQAGPQHKAAFASEVAQITGGSKRDINQKIMRARLAGIGLASGSGLTSPRRSLLLSAFSALS